MHLKTNFTLIIFISQVATIYKSNLYITCTFDFVINLKKIKFLIQPIPNFIEIREDYIF